MKIPFHKFHYRIRFFEQFFLFLVLGLLLSGQLSYSQQSLSMNINRVTKNGELTVRGFSARFPYPILSTVTIVDAQGDYITGLADTARWLGENDIANNGIPISQIWSPFFEYHEEDNRIPPNPDVYPQSFGPYVTEIRWYHYLPTCAMLIMDASSSMTEEITDAQAGANIFVDLMRFCDQAGIVQFSGRVRAYQPLTYDTQILHNLINSTTIERGTAINDAILRGIEAVKGVTCRRLVIIYSDGVDVNSTATAAMVIDTARTYAIPVFTIALGNETEEDTLRAIAEQTGGLFFKAATSNEMEIIYGQLSVITQNYYVTAHGSTDPNYNDTWRTVDLTVNLNGNNVRATGRYFVSGIVPPPKNTDVGIRLVAKTDTFVVEGPDSLPATEPGKEFIYQLTVQNFGLNTGDTIQIVQHLPDSVYFLHASTLPEIITPDSLVWMIYQLDAGHIFEINTTVKFSQNVPPTIDYLISWASLTANNDTTLNNNQTVDTLYVLFPSLPPEGFSDLILEQLIKPDTSIIVAGDTIPVVFWGDSILINLKIKNKGDAPADSIIFWNIIPDSTQFVDFNIPPSYQHGDTLFWIFDSLAVEDSIFISIIGEIVDTFPISPFPIVNIIGVITDNDTTPDNNIDSMLIYIQKPRQALTDLELKFISKTDTTIFIRQQEFPAVNAGDAFEYWIEIHNNGPNRADSIQVIQVLPDSINYIDASIIPSFLSADTLKWYFNYLNITDTIRIRLNFKVARELPDSLAELISSVTIFSPSDSMLTNNFAEDTIKIIFTTIPVFPQCDLAITQSVKTDTSILYNNTNMPAIYWGDNYQYVLKIYNNGPETAKDLMIWDLKPDSVIFNGFNQIPIRVSGDTLFWKFDSLASGDTLHIQFQATVADSLSIVPFLLLNYAGVESPSDSTGGNNLDSTLVLVIGKKADQPELTLIFHSITDTAIIADTDTMNAVRPGEKFKYLINLKNIGELPANLIDFVLKLPDSVQFLKSDVSPLQIATDSIRWQFPLLKSDEAIQIIVDVVSTENMPLDWVYLTGRLQVTAHFEQTLIMLGDLDLIKIIFPAIQPVDKNYNLSITQSVETDTSISISNVLIPAVFVGNSFLYHLRVVNEGPNVAKSFIIRDKLPVFLTLSQFNISPTVIKADSSFWSIDSLANQDTLIISFQALVSETVPYSPFLLENFAGLRAEKDTLIDDNESYSQIYAVKPPIPPVFTTDISVYQVAHTDSFRIINQDTIKTVHDNEFFHYHIRVRNERDIPAEDVKIVDYLPEFIESIEFNPQPDKITNDSLIWQLDTLSPRSSTSFTVKVQVLSPATTVQIPLINKVVVSAKNEDLTILFNNTAFDTIYYIPGLPGDWTAQIQATPLLVEVGKPIKVKVKATTEVNRWDIWVYLADGTIDSGYADNFIRTNSLKVDEWLEIVPDYTRTQCLTNSDEEKLIFELWARDRVNTLKQARTTVVIQNVDGFDIDRNVFVPDKDNTINIKFKLPQNESAVLDLYDITGTKITKIAESQYQSGWNVVTWNGMTEYGQKVGSGFYILTLRSNEYSAWKKLMIVR